MRKSVQRLTTLRTGESSGVELGMGDLRDVSLSGCRRRSSMKAKRVPAETAVAVRK